LREPRAYLSSIARGLMIVMFAQHLANLLPLWGRSIGTGNPGMSFFNRGGAPLTVDPLMLGSPAPIAV
jgi:hypothetical protein